MNKNVSLAMKKAVGSLSQKNHNDLIEQSNGPKKTRSFFFKSGETELFQNEKGITIIKIDRSTRFKFD